MKIQDILFLVAFLFLIFKRDSKLSLYFGLGSILVSIPLFYFQVFFTAERLIWYSFAFIVLSIIVMIFKERMI